MYQLKLHFRIYRLQYRVLTVKGFFSAGDPKAQKYTLDMAKVLAMTCIDIMLKPELLTRIKAEFEEESQ